MQLGKEYLNLLTCNFYSFFSEQNSETFDMLQAFLPLTVAKLSALENSPVYFGPPCKCGYLKIFELFILSCR